MKTFTYASALARSLDMTFGERVTTALQVTLIGLATVFSVLIILWGCISLLRIVLGGKRKSKNAEKAETETVAETNNLPEIIGENQQEDNGALIAAITAAITVLLQEENNNTGFRVVSFRRSDKKSAWNKR